MKSIDVKVIEDTQLAVNLATAMKGDNEEEIRNDAESIKGILANQKPSIPLKTTEEATGSALDGALRSMARNI